MKIRTIAILLAGPAVLLSGCMGAGTTSTQTTVSATDMAAFQKVFMSSYYAERGGIPAGAKGLTPFLAISRGNNTVAVQAKKRGNDLAKRVIILNN